MKLGLRKNRRRDPGQYGPGHLVMEKVGCLDAAYDVIEVDPVHHEMVRVVAKNVSEREAEMMISRRDPTRLKGRKPQGPAHQTRSDKSTLLKYSKYLPAGSMLLFGPLPGLLQSYALQKMKPHFLAAVRKQLISRFRYSPAEADQALVEWADTVTAYKKSATEIAKEIVRIETGKMGEVFVRDPAKKRTAMARNYRVEILGPSASSRGVYTTNRREAEDAFDDLAHRMNEGQIDEGDSDDPDSWNVLEFSVDGNVTRSFSLKNARPKFFHRPSRDPGAKKTSRRAVMALAAKYAKARQKRGRT